MTPPMTDPKELTDAELVRELRDPETNPPNMAWRNRIADRIDALASLSASVGVAVKPLEWSEITSPREDGPAEPTGDWVGIGLTGAYNVYVFDGSYEVTRPDGEYVEHFVGDAEEAKAAAQADYEARIRSALSLPSSGGEVVDE